MYMIRPASRDNNAQKGIFAQSVELINLVYCYLEFKLSYLKNLKLFSIRVKELFETMVL